VAFPVHAQSPGDDRDRTQPIPRVGGPPEPPPWQPGGQLPPDDGFGYTDARPGLRGADGPDEDPLLTQGRRRRRQRKKPLWKELVTLLAVALLLTFLIQNFLGRVYSIPSGSMEKTLHGCGGCTNDKVLVDKLSFAFTDPQPGDVVVFEGPDSWDDDYKGSASSNVFIGALQGVGALVGLAPPNERDFVKRVIAVGGQTVECCDKKMRVIVDGRPLDEPYIYWKNGKPNNRQKFDPVVVPQGTLWVMGDNRNNSADSRSQAGGGLNGVVPIDRVIGKARYVVLPPSRWQGVGDHDPQGDAPVALGAPTWQQGLPAGVGLLFAWPVLWAGRRAAWLLRPRKRTPAPPTDESTVEPSDTT
jgi:signal peptidase I